MAPIVHKMTLILPIVIRKRRDGRNLKAVTVVSGAANTPVLNSGYCCFSTDSNLPLNGHPSMY